MSLYSQDKNLGLPANISLVDGKFALKGGEEKAQLNLSFQLSFIGFWRAYNSRFVPDLLWLLQKPSSVIISFKTLILGKLLRAVHTANPFITILKINSHYEYTERKEYGIAIEYIYNLEPDQKKKTVEFIQI